MSLKTVFFNLFKLGKTEEYDIAQFNANMEIIDEEMHKPPLTVNEIEPDPGTRDIRITTVPLADNFSSDDAQMNEGTYIIRTAGGEASIANGSAWLSSIHGNQIKTGATEESRGTITTANPTAFVSTGWNLYNHSVGYARVVKYSETYGFMIDGTYTSLSFAEALSDEPEAITPVDGYFTVPSNGYVIVTGGNDTDTAIWMTWSDWTEEANSGTFVTYTQTSVDLTGVMVNFPAGLMRIGNVYDEINLNTQKAYSRIQRLEYNAENLANVIAGGMPYDTDTSYIYVVRSAPVVYTISLDGEYTASDHGLEMFIGTDVPVTASSLYGNDLKGKLRRDVLTISQQTLTAAQKSQVRTNIGAAAAEETLSALSIVEDQIASCSTSIVSCNDAIAKLAINKSSRLQVPNGTTSFTITGLTANHVLVKWNFWSHASSTSASYMVAENNPPANLSWTTSANTVSITNDGGTIYCEPVFVLPTAI